MEEPKRDTDSGRRWSTFVFILGGAATLLVVIGIWSASLAIDSSIAETKLDLETSISTVGSIKCGVTLWADPEDLVDQEPPEYFSQGPGRQTSKIDRILRPTTVYREAADPSRSESSDCPWGYVVSDSPLPFFVRTTYGVFPGGELLDADGVPLGSAEGVRTYFSLFGFKIYLNEWRVRSHATSPPAASEETP